MTEDLRTSTHPAQVVAILARRASEALTKPVTPGYKDAAPFLVLRDADGKERIEWLGTMLPDPTRKFGTVHLKDAKSFIGYFGIHGKPDLTSGTAIYAQLQPAQFLAVLNEHSPSVAGWRDHRAQFVASHSPEWSVWEKHDRQPFNGNEAFAYFVEENTPDFIKPSSADMLTVATNFRVKQGVHFDVAQRLDNGDIDLTYRNQVTASAGPASSAGTGKMRIPEVFTLELRVWDGPQAKKYKVDARLRYRLNEGALKLWYELVRPKRVVEAAFKDLWDEIEKATKATILYGTPE